MFVAEPSPTGQALTSFAGRGAKVLVKGVVTVAMAGAFLAVGSVLLFSQAKAFFTAGETGSDVAKIELAPLATRSALYAADGTLLQYLHGEENRLPVAIDKVPPHVVKAVLDAEDERFYEHGPIDLRAMTRAMVSNIQAGEIAEGGSTITQQLVKTALLNPKKDVNRKLQEASLAIRLEKQMTKTQILERYLNTVYFGNGAYGLQAAAERYYQTDVDKLSVGQAVLLAGLIRNPVGADPFGNPEAARDRRDVIIDRMQRLGDVSPDQAVELKSEPLPTPQAEEEVGGSNYFTRHVVDQLLKDPKYLGGTDAERNRLVFRGGINIYTTLIPSAQAQAEQSIAETLPPDRGAFNAALVSVEPSSGAVRAAVSGLEFAQHKVDLVTGDGRQVGSSFKMFTLMAAMEAGDIPADTILGTSPCNIPNPGGEDDPWQTQNNEGESAGVLSLTEATVESVNCAYARLIKLVGPDKVVDVAKRMGIGTSSDHSSPRPLRPDLSLTLGTSDVTPLDMASAYATLATDGEHHDPYFIDRVEDRDGNLIYRSSSKGERAVSAQNARTVLSVLSQVVQRGTGVAAAVPKWNVAGKTGSTDSNTDAWFVGVTPKLATAVWMGAPSGKVPMYNVGIFPKVFGGTYPAMIFSDYTKRFLTGQTPVDFAPPDRVPNQRAAKILTLQNEVPPNLNGRTTRQAQGFTGSNDVPSAGPSQSSGNAGDTNGAGVGGGGRTNTPTVPDAPVVATPPAPNLPSVPDLVVPPTAVDPPPDVGFTTQTTRRSRNIPTG
jgi:penicillin-binding protein 1A